MMAKKKKPGEKPGHYYVAMKRAGDWKVQGDDGVWRSWEEARAETKVRTGLEWPIDDAVGDWNQREWFPHDYLTETSPGYSLHAYSTPGKCTQHNGGKEKFGGTREGSDGVVVEIVLEDCAPVTDDLTEQYAHAERMMLKYTERCEALKKQMAEE